MGIKVTNKIDLKGYAQRMNENINRELNLAIAVEKTRLIDRTQAGQTVSGAPMKAYSPAYAAWKGGSGRSKRGSSSKAFHNANASKSTHPDLTLSGDMLKAITHGVTRLGANIQATISLSRPDQEGKAQGNQAARRFFGLSQEQKKKITERIRKAIKV